MRQTAIHKFTDRRTAGRELGARLKSIGIENPVVIGLARGGVPVAYEVAQALHAPLDVLVVRKIGSPGNPELGIGAVAEGGHGVLNQHIMHELMVSEEELTVATDRARAEVRARADLYRGNREPLSVIGSTAVVVDDGLATGGTARAALRAVRARHPKKLILAVPVGAPETVESLEPEADEVICLVMPEVMWAVGYWYDHFGPTADSEIAELLNGRTPDPPTAEPAVSREVLIQDAGIVGDLVLPSQAIGLVIFAHGSGSSRFSPRNRQVAHALNGRGLGTLLLDLLRPEEERDRGYVFDIELLSQRLMSATRWAQRQSELAAMPIGYFGASTGAAAALNAAADLGDQIRAVVSRGGRPDLATPALPAVRSPVLLIVGGHDTMVLELNREALTLLNGRSELTVVPGATHLFEEHGALSEVAALAGSWFERWLAPTGETTK